MPLFFLGTREWRNRQTRTVQVRVPVMEWGFNSPLEHDETADPSGSAVFVFPGCCDGVAAPVFSCCLWPHGCSGRRVGPGCFVCPWAAARPRAVRAASLRLGASSRSPVRPRRPINFARNSPAACSSIEFVSLELQRLWGVSKNDRDKSRATFGCRWCRLCPWAPQSGPPLPVGVMGGLAC